MVACIIVLSQLALIGIFIQNCRDPSSNNHPSNRIIYNYRAEILLQQRPLSLSPLARGGTEGRSHEGLCPKTSNQWQNWPQFPKQSAAVFLLWITGIQRNTYLLNLFTWSPGVVVGGWHTGSVGLCGQISLLLLPVLCQFSRYKADFGSS